MGIETGNRKGDGNGTGGTEHESGKWTGRETGNKWDGKPERGREMGTQTGNGKRERGWEFMVHVVFLLAY